MNDKDGFFIGWSAEAPAADRRFLLRASLGLVASAALTGGALALRRPGPQPGRWDQGDIKRYRGVLVEAPYPTLLTRDETGAKRAMLLVGYGKVALPARGAGPAGVTVDASGIFRGPHAMLAIKDVDAFLRTPRAAPPFAPPPDEDLGPANFLGEILDAKCWFGAMNPGVGLTHKSCAALCARGRLPLAFCAIGACGLDQEVHLFLDERGEPHGAGIIPFVADAVFAQGRLVRRNTLLEFRVPRAALKRV